MSMTNYAGRCAFAAFTAIFVAFVLRPVAADAQAAWPNRPIRLVVPYAAGGGSDVIARAIASKLSERLAQPIVVDNRLGGGGTIGFDAVAKAAPDGYTLAFTTTAFATIASAGRKLPYDPVKDFTPVGQIGSTPLMVVVSQDSSIKTLQELIEQARAKPKTVTYGSSGVGSMSHLGMELLDSVAKTQMLHVPYKGMAPTLTDLLGGRIDTALGTYASFSQFLKQGKLRGLVVTGRQRSPFAPNVPTAAEAGLPDFEIEFWWGILAPSRVPPAVVQRLNDELNVVLAQNEVRELLAREAAVPTAGSPAGFGKLVADDTARWGKLIRERNIQVE